jgi:hypothetical protein
MWMYKYIYNMVIDMKQTRKIDHLLDSAKVGDGQNRKSNF